MSDDVRQKFAISQIKYIINQYRTYELDHQKIYLGNYCHMCSGMFIEIYDELKYLEILVDGEQLMLYKETELSIASKIIYQYVWTKLHKEALYESLLQFMPKELVKKINSHIHHKYFMYWIPFYTNTDWNNDDVNYYINLEKCQINFDKKYKGTLYLKHYNLWRTSDGMSGTRYQN